MFILYGHKCTDKGILPDDSKYSVIENYPTRKDASKAFMSPTLLQYPNFEKQFCITTDASEHACGAVLSQEYSGKHLPIAYASRNFTKGESN